MIISPARLIADFLMFPPRVERGMVDGEYFNGLQFRTFVEERYRAYRIDDVPFLIKNAFNGQRTLLDWYMACLSHDQIDIVFREGAPRVKEGAFTRWRDLTFRLDPDALVTAAFVRTCLRTPNYRDLSAWGTYITSDDPRLERIARKNEGRGGIADIHTHLSGCECIPVLWLEVVAGRQRLAALREYAPRRLMELPPDSATRSELELEMRAIEDARVEWATIGAPLGRLGDESDGHPSPAARLLWQERRVIAAAWDRLSRNWEGSRQLARTLDRYLFAKTLFTRRHHQYPGGNPGLASFRRHFDRVKPVHRLQSLAGERERNARMVSFCSESPNLHSIEFRIAPLLSVAEYGRFFRRWERFVDESPYLRSKRDLFSFVVHFIRWPEEIDDPAAAGAHEGVRRELDRASAALHRFRLRDPNFARLIKGIDVANRERFTPVEVFSPYLRLLRGIVPAGDGSQPPIFSSSHLRHWGGIVRDGGFVAPHLSRLGLTYHAGEDFYHPLDGLRTMWNAVQYCDMQIGDRIGHGLAAGTDVGLFDQVYGRSIIIPAGEAIDSLAWLHQRLAELGGHSEIMRDIECHLAEVTVPPYSRAVSPDLLVRAKRARHEFPGIRRRRGDEDIDVKRLLEQEESDLCRRHRRRMIGLPKIYSRLIEPIKAAQSYTLRVIAEKGVIIEVNPSSNIATSALDSLNFHPLFRIYQVSNEIGQQIKVAICCDNPGTFATRLENEYALIVEAMKTNGMCGEEAYILVENMVRWAREGVFG